MDSLACIRQRKLKFPYQFYYYYRNIIKTDEGKVVHAQIHKQVYSRWWKQQHQQRLRNGVKHDNKEKENCLYIWKWYWSLCEAAAAARITFIYQLLFTIELYEHAKDRRCRGLGGIVQFACWIEAALVPNQPRGSQETSFRLVLKEIAEKAFKQQQQYCGSEQRATEK